MNVNKIDIFVWLITHLLDFHSKWTQLNFLLLFPDCTRLKINYLHWNYLFQLFLSPVLYMLCWIWSRANWLCEILISTNIFYLFIWFFLYKNLNFSCKYRCYALDVEEFFFSFHKIETPFLKKKNLIILYLLLFFYPIFPGTNLII